MKKYEIIIKGTNPLLWNVIQKELEDEKKKVKKNELTDWEEKNWRRKAELKGNDVLVPSRWIRSCLINSCKRTRLVPHYATRKSETFTQYVESCIFQDGKSICKVDKLKPYGAYVGAQGKNSSTKVWRIRPMLDKWETSFTFVDPYGRMKKEELKELLEYAGMFIGIGDGRSLNFGRFELKKVMGA